MTQTPKPTYRLALQCIGRGIRDLTRCLLRTVARAALTACRFLRPRWKDTLLWLLGATSVGCCAGWQHAEQRLALTRGAVQHAIDSVSALIPCDSVIMPGGSNYATDDDDSGTELRCLHYTDIPE